MKLNELVEKGYGNCEVKDGIMDFIVMPKKGKVYSIDELEYWQTIYSIISCGEVNVFDYRSNDYVKEKVNQGNIFYDKESAKEEIKRREVCHKVEKYSYKFSKEEWENDDVIKWHAYYNHFIKRIDYSRCHHFQYQQLFFKSKEDIQKAINEVGEEDFIKYFLGVEL